MPTERPTAMGSTQLICSKCQAHVSDAVTTKYCDQCGCRVSRKRKEKRRNKKTTHEIPRELPSTQIDVAKSSDTSWYWGTEQLRQLPTVEKAPACGDDLKSNFHPLYPLVKAQTAKSVSRDSHEPTRSLRRACSFGQPSFLPALPQAVQLKRLDSLVVSRDLLKNAADEVSTNSSAKNPCGVLWGAVLSEAIAEFESKKIILSVEIESDERCMCVLAQKLQIEEAALSKYVVASGFNQLRSKHNDLEKKVRMNKEKLSMVQQRLATLYEQRERAEDRNPHERSDQFDLALQPEEELSSTTNGDEHDSQRTDKPVPKRKKKRKKGEEAFTTNHDNEAFKASAILIQKRYRVLRARRLFAEMVKRAHQRVFDPESKRYFYYNPRTRQSQWEMPPILAQANATMARRHRSRPTSAKSMHAAASRIQALYRRRAARHAMRELLLQVYEKVYDPDSNSYYYYCAKTMTSSWEKPKLLRDDEVPTRTRNPVFSQPSQTVQPVQEAAAKKIQTLFRNRASRQFVRDLAKGNIEKHFDADAQSWYYFNNRAQQSFWEQPRHASLSAALPPR